MNHTQSEVQRHIMESSKVWRNQHAETAARYNVNKDLEVLYTGNIDISPDALLDSNDEPEKNLLDVGSPFLGGQSVANNNNAFVCEASLHNPIELLLVGRVKVICPCRFIRPMQRDTPADMLHIDIPRYPLASVSQARHSVAPLCL